jgi:hypothetical protein
MMCQWQNAMEKGQHEQCKVKALIGPKWKKHRILCAHLCQMPNHQIDEQQKVWVI